MIMDKKYLSTKLKALDSDVIDLYRKMLALQIQEGCFEKSNFFAVEFFLGQICDNWDQICMRQTLLKPLSCIIQDSIILHEISTSKKEICTNLLLKLRNRVNDDKTAETFLKFLQLILQMFVEFQWTFVRKEIINSIIDFMFQENCTIVALAFASFYSIMNNFESKNSLSLLWEQIISSGNMKVFVGVAGYIIDQDEIINNIKFWKLLENALESQDTLTEKYSLYVLKLLNTKERFGKVPSVSNYYSETITMESWFRFFNLFESLFEKQPHLILPALSLVKTIQVPSVWLNILYAKMLQSDNSSILKYSVNYILEEKSIENINEKVLDNLLAALNNTFLYIKRKISFKKFIVNNELYFIRKVAKAEWKSVPLHAIMEDICELNIRKDPLTVQCLITIGGKICKLQNKSIRRELTLIYFKCFNENILNLTDQEKLNITFIMYNKNEYLDITSQHIIAEIFSTIDFSKPFSISKDALQIWINMDSRICEKYLNRTLEYMNINLTDLLQTLTFTNLSEESRNVLIKKTNDILAKQNHCCTENANDSIAEMEFLKLYLAMNSNIPLDETSFKKCLFLIDNNFAKVGTKSQFDYDLAKIKSVFVDKFTSILLENDLKDLIIKNVDFLFNVGNLITMENILLALQGLCNEQFNILFPWIMRELKAALKQNGFDGCTKLCQYLGECCNSSEYGVNYLEQIINIDPTNVRLVLFLFRCCDKLIVSDNVKLLKWGLLYGEPLRGDQRHEYEYVRKLRRVNSGVASEVRQFCIKLLFDCYENKQFDMKMFRNLKNELLNMSRDLNIKKSRYFENSKQHRLKLRLTQAIAILQSFENIWEDEFLDVILHENNQPNIVYLMELILAYAMTKEKFDDLLKQLPSFPSRCLSSIIPILYMTTCKLNSSTVAKICIENVLPWTMSQNFTIRLNAQCTIYYLLEHFEDIAPYYRLIKSSIASCLENCQSNKSFEKYHCEFRYNGLDYTNLLDVRNVLVYIPLITNVQIDDLYNPDLWNFSLKLDVGMMKIISGYQNDCKEYEENHLEVEANYDDVQKKANPIIIDDSSLRIEADESEQMKQIIPVASLITKLPNLGGIARTCEVFGIKNFVVKSQKQVEMKEFRNVSMTAEKWLNIEEVVFEHLVDFILKKKADGFQIVGAEQTAKSVDLASFRFPEKCILLLGHEKEGIPGNLINFLDYAVEIKQIGMIRSLNVHVTAALFLWEYYKQYVNK